MSWNSLDYMRLEKTEIELGFKFEELAKKYKRPGSFAKHFQNQGERYASQLWAEEWSKDSYCISYHMQNENMLKNKEILNKHDLLVLTEMQCNSTKNEIKYMMSTSIKFGLEVFKPVLHIQLCIQSKEYISDSPDFSININPLPIVWKRLDMSKDERRALCKKVFNEGFMI